MSSAVPRVCHSFVACRDRPCNIRSHFAQALQIVGSICHFFWLGASLSMSAQQAGSACRQSRLDEAWLAKQAGETASTSGGASRSEPIYPAWYEEHLTEAQKKKFKEYAAAKVEASQARQSLASSSRHLVNAESIFREAQSNFHEGNFPRGGGGGTKTPLSNLH